MSANPERQIWIYDTTLRDGMQCEGLSVSTEDKLRIARRLDRLGVPFIEGGWPGANPKDVQFFWELQDEPLEQAEIVPFCFTRRPKVTAAKDLMLQAIIAAGTRWVTIVGKSWDLHVKEGLKTTLAENLEMIDDTIKYLISQGRRVIYDAEHWFDGYKHNKDYALKTLTTALNAGAQWLVLCDTNGGTLPGEITQVVTDVIESLPNNIQLGIHTHNDSDTAVANALAAVMAGANMVQGTINGYGERCGNANLCSVIPNLQIKLGYYCIEESQLSKLTETSRFVSEVVNLAPNEHAPFVGNSAFAHKGGMHVSAVERNPLTYEHIQPETIGNSRRIVVSEQSGTSNILAKARSFGIKLEKDNPATKQILHKLKQLEHKGYQFEAAEASFELLLRGALGERLQFFTIQGFQVHCDLVQHQHLESSLGTGDALATVKITVNGQDILEAAEGIGPVAALDAALRKALMNFYPQIAMFELTDYKVRILNGHAGTAAITRVLVGSGNGRQRWTTVGVSSNILTASYQAVVDGLEYGLMLHSQTQAQAEASSST